MACPKLAILCLTATLSLAAGLSESPWRSRPVRRVRNLPLPHPDGPFKLGSHNVRIRLGNGVRDAAAEASRTEQAVTGAARPASPSTELPSGAEPSGPSLTPPAATADSSANADVATIEESKVPAKSDAAAEAAPQQPKDEGEQEQDPSASASTGPKETTAASEEPKPDGDTGPSAGATEDSSAPSPTNTPSPVTTGPIRDATQVGSVRWINDTIVVGKNTFRRDDVTYIGDIDGNGVTDLLVASPKAKNRTGAVRLYLMGAEDQFLYSRELVPGKWGFQGSPLRAGDMYGTAVHKLPSLEQHSPCVIAVGAPGDGANDKKRGAVYILQVSNDGSVSKSVKVSAETDKTLDRQHEDNEGFGSNISTVGDLNGDGDYELAVQSFKGSTTMLFLSANHEVKTAVKMHKDDNAGLMGLVKPFAPQRVKKLDSTELDSFSIRPAVSNFCIFNDTNCACEMKSPELGSATCLDAVGIEPNTGRALCQGRDCHASYVCSCEGTEYCSRVEETRDVYSEVEPAGSGLVYCSKTPRTVTVNSVVVGVPLPTPEVSAESFSAYNETHCRCSPKSELTEPFECLDYLRTEQDIAVVCRSRMCNVASSEYACDGIGTSYCKRTFVDNKHYVNDGGVRGEEGSVYCHQVDSKKEALIRLF